MLTAWKRRNIEVQERMNRSTDSRRSSTLTNSSNSSSIPILAFAQWLPYPIKCSHPIVMHYKCNKYKRFCGMFSVSKHNFFEMFHWYFLPRFSLSFLVLHNPICVYAPFNQTIKLIFLMNIMAISNFKEIDRFMAQFFWLITSIY